MKYALLKQVVSELSQQLASAKVSRIYQPDADLFIFRLWNGRENLRMLLRVKADDCRLHLTTREWLNPQQPPRFCQLLRARISRIDRISIVDDDRIVIFDCHGQRGPCRLMAELTGKTANLILIDQENIIIDALKRTSGTESAVQRPLVAGAEYRYPTKNQGITAADTELPDLPVTGLSLNEYVDQRYLTEEKKDVRQDFQRRLQQAVSRQLKKLSKRLEKISHELSQQQGADIYRQQGDLILAHLYQLKAGMTTFLTRNDLSDSPQPIAIELDPRLSPQQNAQAYFKRYKKARRGIEHSQRRLEETASEYQWLEQLAYQLEDLGTPADLETIAEELTGAGVLKSEIRHHKKRTQKPSTPFETISPSGFVIVWGRNNQQNDWLSSRNLKEGDLWFHAKNCPGSHVVLKSSDSSLKPTAEDILYAASIAAGYSKARHAHKVEVMQAEPKAVSRLKAGRPGMVTVNSYRTMMVAPLRLDD